MIKMLEVIVILALIPVCLAQDAGEDRDKVTCTASPAHLHEEGWILCQYPIIKQPTDRLISVVQLIGQTDRHVLSCRWREVHQCDDVRSGYKITQVTGNTLNVTITNVTSHHLGKYFCDMMTSRYRYESEPCDFSIKGVIPPSPQPPSSTIEAAAAGVDQSDPDSGLGGGSIAAIVIGVLIFIAVLVVVIIFCYYKWAKNKKKATKDFESIPPADIDAALEENDHHAEKQADSKSADDQVKVTDQSEDNHSPETINPKTDSSASVVSKEDAPGEKNGSGEEECSRSGATGPASEGTSTEAAGKQLVPETENYEMKVTDQSEDNHSPETTNPKTDSSASVVNKEDAPGEKTDSGEEECSRSGATGPASEDTNTKAAGKQLGPETKNYERKRDQGMRQVLEEFKKRGKNDIPSTSTEHRNQSPTDPSKKRATAGETGQTDPTSDSKDSTHEADVEEEEKEEEEEEEKKEERKALLATKKTGM